MTIVHVFAVVNMLNKTKCCDKYELKLFNCLLAGGYCLLPWMFVKLHWNELFLNVIKQICMAIQNSFPHPSYFIMCPALALVKKIIPSHSRNWHKRHYWLVVSLYQPGQVYVYIYIYIGMDVGMEVCTWEGRYIFYAVNECVSCWNRQRTWFGFSYKFPANLHIEP